MAASRVADATADRRVRRVGYNDPLIWPE